MAMHWTIASVAEACRGHLQCGQVVDLEGTCVAILHGSPAKTVDMIQCRKDNLMGFVLESLRDNPENVEQALLLAFEKMDQKLRDDYGGNSDAFRHDILWRTRDNSSVVVVFPGVVYCMGYAENRVVLSRHGRDFNLQPFGSSLTFRRISAVHKSNRVSDESHFRFFRMEHLNEEDEVLFLGSEVIWNYLDRASGGLSPAFVTRVHAYGMKAAAQQIIGSDSDVPKVLIAIPLTPDFKKRDVPVVKVPFDNDGNQLPMVVPLVNGKPQYPPAITSVIGYCQDDPISECGASTPD